MNATNCKRSADSFVRKSITIVRNRRCRGAFTLIELLVVIAIIGVLAALLLPVFSRAKRKAGQTHCVNSLKQLSLGMAGHLADNQDAFPGLASRANGFHAEDWIYWRTNEAFFPPLAKSPIVQTLGSANSSLFRCPLDREDSERVEVADADGPYGYSYGFTGFGLADSEVGLEGKVNLGMASVYPGANNSASKAHLFKQTSIRSPAQKIMLAEEAASREDDEHVDGGMLVINDGRWMPDRDLLTARHSGKANAAFADGHVEAVTWKFGTNLVNSRPDL